MRVVLDKMRCGAVFGYSAGKLQLPSGLILVELWNDYVSLVFRVSTKALGGSVDIAVPAEDVPRVARVLQTVLINLAQQKYAEP